MPLSHNRELYQSDNQLHVTLVFGLLTDFWSNPVYDHVALICEYYDTLQEKISVALYHVSMRDDWTMHDVTQHCGYSLRDYHIRKESSDVIVERMMCHPKYKSHFVRYEPYKTFSINRTDNVMEVLVELDALAKEATHPYSVYGASATKYGMLKGRHNCISFVADVLWKFGVFKNDYSRRDVLRYSQTYAPEALSPYARCHQFIKRWVYTPECLKHLVDNKQMLSSELKWKNHNAADLEARRSLRYDKGRFLINDALKLNIVRALILKHGKEFLTNKMAHNSPISEEEKEEKDVDQQLISLANVDGNFGFCRDGTFHHDAKFFISAPES